MKTPITWYGGKQNMVKHILPLIPEHSVYVEPFFGGGAVFFSKPPVKCEVINDLNKEATNFYYQVKVNHAELHTAIDTTLHSHQAYSDAKVVYTYPHLFDGVKRAWAFHTVCNQSFSAGLTTFGFDRSGTTAKKIANKSLSFSDALAERLRYTTIECDDALKVINRYDTEEAFIYVNPPYFNSNCGHYKGYSEADFTQLLENLKHVKGKFLLSSYPSKVLAQYASANGWNQLEFEKPIAVSKNARGIKTEVLTANYSIK
jgi:DNA adenine methylase